jgi:hypothetical protein
LSIRLNTGLLAIVFLTTLGRRIDGSATRLKVADRRKFPAMASVVDRHTFGPTRCRQNVPAPGVPDGSRTRYMRA